MLICALDLGRSGDTVSFEGRRWKIPHNEQGWEALDRQLPPDCEVVFEGRDAALETTLGHRSLFSLEPGLSGRLRKALQESKDDARDAWTLEQLRQLRPEKFQPIPPIDPTLLQLRQKTRVRRALVKQRTMLLEQLQAVHARSARQAQSRWLAGFQGTPEACLVQVLSTIGQQIKTLEREITQQGQEVPSCVLARSIQGMGKTLSAEIVSELRGIAPLGHRPQVRAYAGTSPVTISSGKYKGVRLRRRCNHRARNALYLFAFCSMRFSSLGSSLL